MSFRARFQNFNFLIVVAILATLTTLSYVFNFSLTQSWHYQDTKRAIGFGTGRNWVIRWDRYLVPINPQYVTSFLFQRGYIQHGIPSTPNALVRHYALLRWISYDFVDAQTRTITQQKMVWIAIQGWIFPTFLWILTGLLYRSYRKRITAARRIQAGQCANCGYDLRATPERCPECGTIPTSFPDSNS